MTFFFTIFESRLSRGATMSRLIKFYSFICLFFILCLSTCSTVEQDCLPPLESSGPASGPTTAPPAAQQQRIPIHKPFTQSRLPPDLPMHPAPRHITEEELRVLEGCLHRWRSEVENDTRGKSISLSLSLICSTLWCKSKHEIGTYQWIVYDVLSTRSSGQYYQNPQNHWFNVLWQIYDAGEQTFL